MKNKILKVGAAEHAALDHFVRERGYKMQEVATRIIGWFLVQDRTLQAIVLGMVSDEDKIELFDLLKKRLAGAGSVTDPTMGRRAK